MTMAPVMNARSFTLWNGGVTLVENPGTETVQLRLGMLDSLSPGFLRELSSFLNDVATELDTAQEAV